MNTSKLFKPIYYGALTVFTVFMLLFFATLLPDIWINNQDWIPAYFKNLLTAGGSDRVARGEYLAFLIGVPLATAASAIAALIAQSSHEVAHRQEQIQTSDFLDAKLSARLGDYVETLSAIDRLYEIGHDLRERYQALEEKCEQCSANFERVLADGRDPDEQNDDMSIATEFKHWVEGVEPLIREIGEQMDTIVANFMEMTVDPFWGAAFENQTAEGTHWNRPMLEVVKANRRMTARRIARILRFIAHRLRMGAETSAGARAIAATGYHAYKMVRHDNVIQPLAFIGAMLELGDESGRHMSRASFNEKRDRETITTFEIRNNGAAALVSIFNAVPSKAAFRDAVQQLFPNLDLRNFIYFTRMPEKSKIVSDEMSLAARTITDNPALLVYEATAGGGGLAAAVKPGAEPVKTKKSNASPIVAMLRSKADQDQKETVAGQSAPSNAKVVNSFTFSA